GQRGEGDIRRGLACSGELPDPGAGQAQDDDDSDKCFFHFTGMVCTPLSAGSVGAAGLSDVAFSTGAGEGRSCRLSGETIWNNFTTLLTPGTLAAALPARSPSAAVTLPSRYTMPRSVVTLMVRLGTSLVLTRLALTLEVIQVSLVRT